MNEKEKYGNPYGYKPRPNRVRKGDKKPRVTGYSHDKDSGGPGNTVAKEHQKLMNGKID